MRFHRSLLALAIIVCAAAVNAADYVEGEVLVRFKANTARAQNRLTSAIGATVAEEIVPLGVQRIALGDRMTVADGIAYFRSSDSVEYVEPNYIAHADVNDTYMSPTYMWGMYKIRIEEAWNWGYRGNPSIPVAVLDSGWQRNHPDLQGKVINEIDYVNGGTADDGNGHGTHTAGTIGAATNNGIGIAAVGYNTPLMIVRVLDNAGNGSYANIANGITWAANSGAKVINMSLGGSAGSTTLQNAVNYAWGRGVVVVASAGNRGNTSANYPAFYTNCVAVAATDQSDRRATFSTYGSWVDCAAPGVMIASTYPTSSYVYMDGTSMAAPHVSALAALVWDTPFGSSATAVRNRVQSTGDTVTNRFGSYPTRRINAARAVGAIP